MGLLELRSKMRDTGDRVRQFATAKLLGTMTDGANLPDDEQRPPQGGLLATPPFNPNAPQGLPNQNPSPLTPQAPPSALLQQSNQGLLAQMMGENPMQGAGPGLSQGRSTSPGGDPNHAHRKGVRGLIRHAFGADRISPAVGAALSPEDREHFLNRGILSQLIERSRAGGEEKEAINTMNLRGLTQARDLSAQQQAMWEQIQAMSTQIQDPQQRLEYVARMAASAGLPQGEQAGLAAQRLETQRAPTDEPQILRNVPGKDSKPMIQGLDRNGNVVWEKPDTTATERGTAREEAEFQRMSNRAEPLAASFQRETERHQIVAEALTTLNGLREPALAGDGPAQHMLVFSLMKLADPGSAVRQDERADTKNAANVPEQLRAAWNKLLGGGGNLSPETVRGFLSTVDSTKRARIRDFDALRKQFERRAGILKVDPELVVSDYFAALRDEDGAPPASLVKTTRVKPAGASDADWAAFLKTKGERP